MVICVSRAFAQQPKKKDNLKSPGDEVEKKERLLVVYSTATSTQIPNHETTKKRCHEEEVERNCKMFANSFVLNPGKDIYMDMSGCSV